MHMKNNIIYLDFTDKIKFRYKFKNTLRNIIKKIKSIFIKSECKRKAKSNTIKYYNKNPRKNHAL